MRRVWCVSPLQQSLTSSSLQSQIKKRWAAFKSKLKGVRGVDQPIQVTPSPQKQIEIDPSPKGSIEVAPPTHEAAPYVDLPPSEDNRPRTHSEPARASLSSLPGLWELNGTLSVSPNPKPVALDGTHLTSPPNHTPELDGLPGTAPRRQESGSSDSVRSDRAAFGDTQHASNDAVGAATNHPENSSVEIPHVRISLVQNMPTQAQHSPMNQIEKVEPAKLVIPGPTPVFTPPHQQGTPARSPGPFPPLFTPSPQFKLLGHQQKSPVTPANMVFSPSPFMAVPDLGSPFPPIPATLTAPTTPIMPGTPLKHQSKIPAVIGQAPNVVANLPPILPLRSPNRPPPSGLDAVVTAGGKKNDFGVIGGHRVCRLLGVFNGVVDDQSKLQVVGEPGGKHGSNEVVPLGKVGPTPKCDVQDEEERADPQPHPSKTKPEAVYIGEMKYYVGRYLGGGGMGKVYSVVSKESMQLTALKVIRRGCLNSGDFAMIKGEWSVLKAISEAKFFHTKRPNGIQFVQNLLESWYDKENIYFIMVRQWVLSRTSWLGLMIGLCGSRSACILSGITWRRAGSTP